MEKSRILMIHPECNPGKIAILDALQVEYANYVGICVAQLVDWYRFDLPKPDFQNFFPEAEKLSSQIQKNARAHAVGIVSSWAATAYTNLVKPRITKLKKNKELSADAAKILYTIGKHKVQEPRGSITQEHIAQYWTLLESLCNHPAITTKIGMRLSQDTATLTDPEETVLADFWLNVSTLTPYKRVAIPLVGNPYIKKCDELSKGILARKDGKGRWRFEALDQHEFPDPTPVTGAPKIGLDVGLNVIVAASDGRTLGADLKPRFDKQYDRVKRARANRQQQNLKKNSPRLDRMEQRLSGLTKSAVGNAANLLIALYPGYIFVMEDLDLSGCKGAKRFCYRMLYHYMVSRAIVEAVNPAYTSQLCPSCGFFSRKNRNGTKFCCVRCGRKGHADVIGAFNVLGRSENKHITCDDNPSDVREVLARLYWSRRNPGQDCPQDFLRKRNKPKPIGCKLTTGWPAQLEKRPDHVS